MTSSSGAGTSPCTPLQPAFHLPLQPCVTDRLAQSGPFESWRREKICRWRFRRCRRPSGSGWSQGTRRAWTENYFPSVLDVTQDSAWVTGAGEQLASLLSSERFLCLSVLFLIVLRTRPSQLVALVERKVGSGVSSIEKSAELHGSSWAAPTASPLYYVFFLGPVERTSTLWCVFVNFFF